MIDFQRLRQSMVDSQLRPNDVTDPRILAAMLEVPRERFVPPSREKLAYLDDDLPVLEGGPHRAPRYLIEPMILARLIQALAIGPDDRILDVGCATGYSTAVLARLASQVVGLEEDGELAAEARKALAAEQGVRIAEGKLIDGAPEQGPFDGILLNGSVEKVPEPLLAQLNDGGRLVAVLRSGPVGRATLYVRGPGGISSRPLFDAAIPALPGFEQPRGFTF